MEEHYDDQEIEDLKRELEHYEKEKERLRKIIGQVGGVPKFNTKLINTLFIGVILISLVISSLGGERWRIVMIEVATVALALKILYMMHCMMKVNHFKFWMLSSIEWRLNDIIKRLRKIENGIGGSD